MVELCDKEATTGGLCGQHRRKYVKGELQVDLSEHKVWDVCSRRHRWTLSNIHWESIPGKATKRRRCRKCLALKAAKRRMSDKTDGIRVPSPVQPENEEMSRALDDLGVALTQGVAPCKGRSEWTDYSYQDTPTEAQAIEMCSGCPFLEACDNAAIAQRPGWGVWGGNVWYMGIQLSTQARREEMLENEKKYEGQ